MYSTLSVLIFTPFFVFSCPSHSKQDKSKPILPGREKTLPTNQAASWRSRQGSHGTASGGRDKELIGNGIGPRPRKTTLSRSVQELLFKKFIRGTRRGVRLGASEWGVGGVEGGRVSVLMEHFYQVSSETLPLGPLKICSVGRPGVKLHIFLLCCHY